MSLAEENPFALLFLILFLIFLNGFFVTVEFTLLRIRKTRLDSLYKSKRWGSKHLERVMDDLNLYIISSQIGITITTILFGYVILGEFGEFFSDSLVSLVGDSAAPIIAFILTVFFAAFFYSVIGEISPKIVAIQNIESIAITLAPFIYWSTFILRPFTGLFRRSAMIFLKLLRQQTVRQVYTRVYSEDELKLIVAQSQQEGEIDEAEEQLINRVLDFTDTRVNEIFTPRFEIVAFDVKTPVDKIISKAKETGYSRFPVYRDKLDQVVGFVHVKDILISDYQSPDFNIDEVLRPVFTIHEAMRLDILLRKMQSDRSQVAIVVDEYGSVEGIVTIEDILESIVGPIDDEFDITSVGILQEIEKNKYLVDGKVTIDVFNEALSVTLQSEDSVTMAGFIVEHLETVPEEGSKLHHATDEAVFEFKVKEMDGNRIDKTQVMVRWKTTKEETEEIEPITSLNKDKENDVSGSNQ